MRLALLLLLGVELTHLSGIVELKERSEVLQATLDDVLAGTALVQEEFDATRSAFRPCALLELRPFAPSAGTSKTSKHANRTLSMLIRGSKSSCRPEKTVRSSRLRADRHSHTCHPAVTDPELLAQCFDGTI